MLSTVPAALVEPKKKSQGVAAKAKRLKRIRENPDFIEAVQEERLVAQHYSDAYDGRVYVFGQKMIERNFVIVREREDTVELKNEYNDKLKGNKVLLSMRSRGTRRPYRSSLRCMSTWTGLSKHRAES
jgi:hypothetical protein